MTTNDQPIPRRGHVMIRAATIHDVGSLAPLFDAYRQFYQQASDIEGARRFLSERMEGGESHVIMAVLEEAPSTPIGFVQLYPTYSSVRIARALVVNDLWVVPTARRQGVARTLIREAHGYAIAIGVRLVSLSTATDNVEARALYESEGYALESGFEHYLVRLLA